jgi:hypothetical protein
VSRNGVKQFVAMTGWLVGGSQEQDDSSNGPEDVATRTSGKRELRKRQIIIAMALKSVHAWR